ncbi:hypothetical protein, partial [Streptomyces sp. NPDC057496]|uniref:hypothetical protein n=1 Tax=Streptomyces sp. NPDC057496 TaxID=3346149 RepID=UPI0036920DCC
ISTARQATRQRLCPAHHLSPQGGRTLPDAALDDIADQGGEGGRLAAALRDELNTAKAEPCATLELDLDAIRAMYPTKPIDDGSDVYVPLPHQVHWRSTGERCLVP